MKTEVGATLVPARDSEGVRTGSKLVAAQSSSGDSTGTVGSSSTRGRSCRSSITSGWDTKRLRRTIRMEAVYDVAAGDDVMSEEEGADVKLELGLSSPSGRVPPASSYLRGRQADERIRARPSPG